MGKEQDQEILEESYPRESRHWPVMQKVIIDELGVGWGMDLEGKKTPKAIWR
jgi:hypothetical protein